MLAAPGSAMLAGPGSAMIAAPGSAINDEPGSAINDEPGSAHIVQEFLLLPSVIANQRHCSLSLPA